jgi:hypothetical protein
MRISPRSYSRTPAEAEPTAAVQYLARKTQQIDTVHYTKQALPVHITALIVSGVTYAVLADLKNY